VKPSKGFAAPGPHPTGYPTLRRSSPQALALTNLSLRLTKFLFPQHPEDSQVDWGSEECQRSISLPSKHSQTLLESKYSKQELKELREFDATLNHSDILIVVSTESERKKLNNSQSVGK
jgi:hypothetical protein